jgi:TetR/AcrR family transcriptional repressor of nem operon
MGRSKSYERDVVTRKAMQLFWKQGVHATTTKELADHMGINTFSLFAEFGSKQGLFESALELYEKEVVTRYFGALEAPEAGLPEIVEVVDFFASHSGSDGPRLGCFLTNVAIERAPFDDSSHQAVEAYVERVSKALRHALTHAQNLGQVRADIDCEAQSCLLACSLIGFWVLMRAGVSGEVVGAAAAALKGNLDLLQVATV